MGPRKKAKEVTFAQAAKKPSPKKGRAAAAIHKVPGAKESYFFAAVWMLREIELSNLEVSDLSFPGGGVVKLWLAESKMDPEAEGTLRTLQCVCQGKCKISCPLSTSKRVVRLAEERTTPQPPDGNWLVVNASGKKAKKKEIVNAWKALFGKEVTGHSARRSGALHYVREGHALDQIKHLGRWKSDVILEYAKEALAEKPALSNHSNPIKPVLDVQVLSDKLLNEAAEMRNDLKLELEAVKSLLSKTSVSDRTEPPQLQIVESKGLKVRSHRSGIIHDIDTLFENETPHLWRTKCGWPFGFANYTFVAASSSKGGCKKCACGRAFGSEVESIGREPVKLGTV